MHTTDTKDGLNQIIQAWKQEGLKTALIPTMGALHEGHTSLVEIAKEQADKVIVSIFVNPTQFAPDEDFESYPRNLNDDLAKLKAIGTHLVYMPSAKDIYPNGPALDLKAGDPGKGLDTDFRPHFFDGVATVVRTLFDQVKPDLAVFGQKDYQQLEVIKDMNETLLFGIEIIGGPIIRDEYGLALSSRNAYLTSEELNIARKLNVILRELAEEITTRPQEEHDIILTGLKAISNAGFSEIDYLETRWGRLLCTARIGGKRLLDNVSILPNET